MLAIGAGQRGELRRDTTSTADPALRAVLERLGYRRLWSELIREID